MIPSIAWVLPRPPKSKYPGGFPLHAEIKILREIGFDPKKFSEQNEKILHPFGGKAEYGVRCDLNISVSPDYICDAHNLPFQDNTFEVTFLDPPYNESYSKSLYNTPKPKYKQYTKEAVRVTKSGGYVIVYHWANTPTPEGCQLIKRIFIGTRTWHTPREVHINRKI